MPRIRTGWLILCFGVLLLGVGILPNFASPLGPDHIKGAYFCRYLDMDHPESEHIVLSSRETPESYGILETFGVWPQQEALARRWSFGQYPLALRNTFVIAPNFFSAAAKTPLTEESFWNDPILRAAVARESRYSEMPAREVKALERGERERTQMLWWNIWLLATTYVGSGVLIVLGAILIRRFVRFDREQNRLQRGQCLTCGYELTGLSDGSVCPECGK